MVRPLESFFSIVSVSAAEGGGDVHNIIFCRRGKKPIRIRLYY